jgi:hypothetical protein
VGHVVVWTVGHVAVWTVGHVAMWTGIQVQKRVTTFLLELGKWNFFDPRTGPVRDC